MNARSSNKKTTLWQLLITSMTARIKDTINKAATTTKVGTITKDGRTTPTKVGEIIPTMAGGTTITEEAETTKEIDERIIYTLFGIVFSMFLEGSSYF